jgi:N,N'-diacetyllegionaminate synthase
MTPDKVIDMLEIGGHKIGGGAPPFVIAEAGVNHNGDIALARELVDAAAETGAHAVKFQTFKASQIVTPEAPKAAYQDNNVGTEISQLDMLQALELSFDAHHELRDRAHARGLIFLSSPFDEASLDLLVKIGVPALKIPSGELTNLPLLAQAAETGLPLIISTGMATMEEIATACTTIRDAGDPPFALLHCLSSYPADPAETNLHAMETMAEAFSVPVGYSDHTMGIEISLAAGALGACIVEKHLTLDRTLPGPDHSASLEPDAFGDMVRGLSTIHGALGDGNKRPMPSEISTKTAARKSLVTSRALAIGTVLADDMIDVRRPGNGFTPDARETILGSRLRRDVAAGLGRPPADFEPTQPDNPA